jgi:hypothetical protein
MKNEKERNLIKLIDDTSEYTPTSQIRLLRKNVEKLSRLKKIYETNKIGK